MNPDDRTGLFDALRELAHRYPHWRVGQLLANVAGWADAEPWDVEDDQLLAAARTHLARREAETSSTSCELAATTAK